MPLDKLLQAIEAKAALEAEEILRQARDEADQILETVRAASETDSRHLQEELRVQREREWSHRLSQAQLDSRKQILQTKTEILDQIFDRVLRQFKSLDQEQYRQWLTDQICRMSDRGLQIIVFAEEDSARLPAHWIQDLRKRITSLEVTREIVVKFSGTDFTGGFILQFPDYEIIVTCEAMVDELRESMEAELAALLFDSK